MIMQHFIDPPITENEIPKQIRKYFLQHADLRNQPVRPQDNVRLIKLKCSHCRSDHSFEKGYGRVETGRRVFQGYNPKLDTFQVVCDKCLVEGLDYQDGEYVKQHMALKTRILRLFQVNFL